MKRALKTIIIELLQNPGMPLRVSQKCVVVLFCLVLLLVTGTLHAGLLGVRGQDYIVGAGTGYSFVQGHYGDEVSPAPLFSLFVIPYIGKFMMAEFDIAYSAHALEVSRDSSLTSVGLSAGPLFYYPVLSLACLYAGVSLRGDYLRLDAVRTGQEERTFKSGFAFKAGFIAPIRRGLGVRFGSEYTQVWLSDIPFRNVNITLGVTYNYNAFMRTGEEYRRDIHKVEDRYREVNVYYEKGIGAFEEGSIDKSREFFSRVLKYDNSHAGAIKYMEQVEKLEEIYLKAETRISAGSYFEAILLLSGISKKMKRARQLLQRTRALLTGSIPKLEERGIQAYERKDYAACITIMKRIRLIAPNNRVAGTYLPRALKRYEAIKKLR